MEGGVLLMQNPPGMILRCTDEMSNKNLKRYFIYLMSALILPTIFQLIYGKLINKAKDIYTILLLSLLFFSLCAVIIVAAEGTRFILRIKKRKTCLEMLQSINTIASSISFADGIQMFEILEQDYSLYESIDSKEGRFKRALRNSHHTVYHSTTAKNHLNWIEFVFWSFLSRIHSELGCDIIVSLHYDERARETGLQSLKERERYNKMFKSYSNIAKTLIGKDITVLDEEDFHIKRKYARLYASTFHNRFVKCIIQYVNQVISGDLDYKGFMRKISYIESVFPIMVFSKAKMKFSRLYVLDRELAHEVWQQSPFFEFKNSYGIFFITAKTIRYANGEPIRIFLPEETVNITDDIVEIKAKLAHVDLPTKNVMFQLLTATSNNLSSKYTPLYASDKIDELLVQIITEIKSNYGFTAV